MKTVFWQQGEAHGLVWDQGLALVSDEIGVDAAASLWNRCRDGLTMGQFLEALALSFDAALQLAEQHTPILQARAEQVEAARYAAVPAGELLFVCARPRPRTNSSGRTASPTRLPCR